MSKYVQIEQNNIWILGLVIFVLCILLFYTNKGADDIIYALNRELDITKTKLSVYEAMYGTIKDGDVVKKKNNVIIILRGENCDVKSE